jgi:shikimate dehydrogenase
MSGRTRLAAVIGDPARHSLSPTLYNAAFGELGLDWVYLAFDVPRGRAVDALEAMRVLGVAGYSVTMPHKADVAAAVETLSPIARTLGAVNCVINDNGTLRGDNSDGDGFLRGLQFDHGFDVSTRRCVVLGGGGAARAVVAALARAGASAVSVINRSPAAAEQAALLAGAVGEVGVPACLRDADLVVNATSVGMSSAEPEQMPCDPAMVPAGAIAVDLIYHPFETRWLHALRTRGVECSNGLSMLVHQAATQFEWWTGQDAPIAVMRGAVAAELAQRV